MNNQCPELIREWVDNDVLPELADGHNSASTITDIVFDEATERLESEKQDADFYTKKHYDPLIDSWLVIGDNKSAVIDYIQTAFNSWEEWGKRNE